MMNVGVMDNEEITGREISRQQEERFFLLEKKGIDEESSVVSKVSEVMLREKN